MRRVLLAVIATAIGLALLLSFKPHDVTSAVQPPAAVAQSENPVRQAQPEVASRDDGNGGGDAKAGGTTPAPTATARRKSDRTVSGDVADTRWGPVQVRITVTGGKISDVQVLQSPSGNRRDTEINDVALPILQQEALAAQSAQIDSVSGATYTSEGYVTSLQSAIDRAGL
jgi:uncharacterized protein with FMN-binding domain